MAVLEVNACYMSARRCGFCLCPIVDVIRACGCTSGWVEDGWTSWTEMVVRTDTLLWPPRETLWSRSWWMGKRPGRARSERHPRFDPVAAGVTFGPEVE